MKDLIKALYHCYANGEGCRNCPYEKDLEKCQNLFKNIETIINKVAEYVEFDNIQNIVKIIIKKGDKNNESKD